MINRDAGENGSNYVGLQKRNALGDTKIMFALCYYYLEHNYRINRGTSVLY
jgi:hypothetical protein